MTKFVAAYLAGDAETLRYLTPAGVRIGGLAAPHRPVEQPHITAAGIQRRTAAVLVDVPARDEQTRAVIPLRLRLQLIKTDRWLVAGLDPKE